MTRTRMDRIRQELGTEPDVAFAMAIDEMDIQYRAAPESYLRARENAIAITMERLGLVETEECPQQ